MLFLFNLSWLFILGVYSIPCQDIYNFGTDDSLKMHLLETGETLDSPDVFSLLP
jgi:hypothetical protein